MNYKMNEIKKIPFNILKEKFQKFIDDEKDKQTLFSGPFGSGKTTFLKDFFNEKNSEYDVVHIFPINYPLHSNTDIYEVLKYDLILELISKGLFAPTDISSFLAYKVIIADTVDGLVMKLVSIFSKTSRSLKGLVDLIEDSQEEIKKKVKELQDPALSVRNFQNVISKLQGYEYDDYVTTIIREKLLKLSEQKKTVLIVDDLDRIDPEHLFRIISVFSAHIDYDSKENKFGFDKIIFVGDLDNIRTMYAHRFGSSKSFQGYISKLSYKEPFNFDPAEELYSALIDILSSHRAELIDSEDYFYPFKDSNLITKDCIVYIVSGLLKHSFISLRDLTKDGKIIDYGQDAQLYVPSLDVVLLDFPLFYITRLLKSFQLGFKEIIKAFHVIAEDPLTDQEFPMVRRRSLSRSYCDWSSIFLIAVKPSFKIFNYNTNEQFEFDLYGEKFKIVSFQPPNGREIEYRLDEKSVSAARFFLLLENCLKFFNETILGTD